MREILYASPQPLNSLDRKVLKQAKLRVFGNEQTSFRRTQPGPGVLGFGIESDVKTLSSAHIAMRPFSERYLAASLAKLTGYPFLTPFPDVNPDKILYFDLETHDVNRRWSMSPQEFFRLGQWAWGPTGDVYTTDSYWDMVQVMAQAEAFVGHNIHAFDLSVFYGIDSLRPLQLAKQNRVFDTFTYAALALPAPTHYTDRSGRKRFVDGPEDTLFWLGLDNLCYQLGLDGKVGSLTELAEEFGGYGEIPTDDPRHQEYARGDITALQEITTALLVAKTPDEYDWREQLNAAIDAQNSRNGFRVDIPRATARRDELAARKAVILADLQKQYDFPTNGTMPWRTTAGKKAIMTILEENGITPETRPDWTKTKTGNISLGGKVLVELTQDTPAFEVGQALAEVMGHRSLSQLTLDCVQPDGKVHPEISAVQRSGRKCLPVTDLLLTRRGVLSWDEVKVGDETIDVDGEWVKVTDVHHYEDQETVIWSNSRDRWEATAEHRWVQTTESGYETYLAPLEAGSRRFLRLTPETHRVNLSQKRYPNDMSASERFAALVGLLVTDGRCAVRSDSNSLTLHVYQTEKKFYHVIRPLLSDEWVISDHYDVKTDHHDIRLSVRVVAPLLEKAGLDLTGNLRHSGTLMTWALGLTERESRCFLMSAWLADGNTATDSKIITCKNRNLAPVLQLVAYRCGFRPDYREYRYDEHYIKSGRVALRRDRVSVRTLTATDSRSDVWCVTTETGTFTAWNQQGPYLTGNSVSSPGLTVWTSRGPGAVEKSYYVPDSEDELLVAFDYSQADARIVAAYSGDVEYAKRFEPGADSHEITGRLIFTGELVETNDYSFHIPHYDDDPEKNRHDAKNLGHAYSYRAGVKKLSLMARVPLALSQKFVDAMKEAYPDVTRWQNEAENEGQSGFITNDWGRTMIVSNGQSYTQSPALYGQSGTRELMVDALIRMLEFDVRIITWVRAQVHDELIFSIPKKELHWAVDKIVELMECEWGPSDGSGQKMWFPVSHSEPAINWFEASHG